MDLSSLVTSHAHLAGSLAYGVWRKAPHAMEKDELESIANLALVLAAERWPIYCAEHGYSPERIEYFEPYASRRMRGAIIDTLRSTDFATRSQRTKAKALQAAGSDSGASEDQLTAATGLTKAEVRDTLAATSRRPVSLDAPVSPEAEAAHLPTTTVEGDHFVSTVLASVTATVAGLSEAHQAVLALHYFSAVELKEVAGSLGITESRASHLHTEAVLAVHAAMALVATDRAA